MYNFIDVTETQEGTLLPSEALKINGEYIENLITGYRTLTVEGREALSPEISSYNTGIRDGSIFNGKRYPARTIRVTYQLVCESDEDFREAYNKLGGILNVKDAELIFDDEPDKYFIGTPSRIGEVVPGRNSVTGEFDILCLDPFKYSVMEHEATADVGDSSVIIDYGGTYKSYPKLVAEFHKESDVSEDGETVQNLTGDGECGYVAFFNEREKIIQLGDPDETDGDEEGNPASQTLRNADFSIKNAWGSAAKKQWAVNSGVLSNKNYLQNGTPGAGVASYIDGTASGTFSNKILSVTSEYSDPHVVYEVFASVTNRKEKTCDVTVTVKTRLAKSYSYFGNGYILLCSISLGSKTISRNLKEKSDYWRGTTVHTQSFFFGGVSIGSGNYDLPEIKIKVDRPDNLGSTGILYSTKCSGLIVPAYVAPTAETYYLTASNFGANTNYGWHGTAISRSIPADSSGVYNATNFNLSFCAKFIVEETKQRGMFECNVINDGKILCGVSCKKQLLGTKADVYFYVNGSLKERIEVDVTKGNGLFSKGSSVRITKSGSRVTFSMSTSITKTYTDSNIAEKAAQSVTFGLFQYLALDLPASFGLCSVKFVKDNCDRWKDIPNKFKTNDVCEADCRTGEISLNGVASPSLGALGNDWEDFYLAPGVNHIGMSYSEWVSAGYEPKFKVKYREVYL